MFIYLDESYNLQKKRGKLFISLNGFVIEDKSTLFIRKHWKNCRLEYTNKRRRIHAVDSHFEELRLKSIGVLARHQVKILSILQMVKQIPHSYFGDARLKFDLVYTDLLKQLLTSLNLEKNQSVRIIVDARQKNGIFKGKLFVEHIQKFLTASYPDTNCLFEVSPSYNDILVELADFVSNILYREYQSESRHVFSMHHLPFLQIKNPL